MKASALSAYYQTPLASAKKIAGGNGPWKETAQQVAAQFDADFASADDLIEALHQLQRLHKIETAGLSDNQAFFDEAKAANIGTWKTFKSPPASAELQNSLGDKLYNMRPDTKDMGVINVGNGARLIGAYLVDKCIANNAPAIVNVSDPAFDALVLNAASDEGVKALGQNYVEMMTPVNRIMTARPGMPDEEYKKASAAKASIYQKEVAPVGARTSSGDLFYTLTVIPTRKDAEIDGIEFQDYTDLFFEMCDQPWDEINKAHIELIKEFNAASQVHITNNDGTDIKMSLVDNNGEHFTFCNSLIAKNVPGSEIFSAPRVDSVEGKIVAKGKFITHHNKLVENLTMEFEKGKLVRYHAEKGQENFEQEINIDDGARFVGELGIGTNPHLKQHVANGLLVEKIGGSFHLALGKPYTYTEYGGEPVKVDNGNRSSLHWDITTMLYGKEGRIYLDGRLVMDNGMWVDKKYDVLNRGWAAVPKEKRPLYWQKKLAA